jgi:hypothetical protein
LVCFADPEPQPLEAAIASFSFGCDGQGGGLLSPSLLETYRDVSEFWRVGEGEVGMPERIVVLPSDG